MLNQPFKLKEENVEIEFIVETGTVVDTNKHVENVVAGTRDSITGFSIVNHEVWLKFVDGLERRLDLTRLKIPLRSDQLLTVISARSPPEKQTVQVALLNQTSEEVWLQCDAQELCGKLGLTTMYDRDYRAKCVIALFAISVTAVIFGINASIEAGIIAGFICVGVCSYIYKKWYRVEDYGLVPKLNVHLDEIIKDNCRFNIDEK